MWSPLDVTGFLGVLSRILSGFAEYRQFLCAEHGLNRRARHLRTTVNGPHTPGFSCGKL